MDRLLRWKRQMDASETIGPRIVLAGVMDGRGPYTAPTDVLVDTEAEARAAIEKYKAAGYIQIKIYSSIQPKLVPYIVRVAHENGMRVSGHVPAGMIADQFVDAGVDEFQHINFFFLNFLPEEASKTNTRARLTLPAEHAAALDPNSPEVVKFIAKLKEKQMVVDPTLGVFEESIRRGPASRAPVMRHPRSAAGAAGGARRSGRAAGHGRSGSPLSGIVSGHARHDRAAVPRGRSAGDRHRWNRGLMLDRELELWVQAGIPRRKCCRWRPSGRLASAARTGIGVDPGGETGGHGSVRRESGAVDLRYSQAPDRD